VIDNKKAKWTRWHDGFRLDLAAVEIDSVWYPEFALSRGDGFKTPWKRPESTGKSTEAEALRLASVLALKEVIFWRAVSSTLTTP
jgi:hypothetical protein